MNWKSALAIYLLFWVLTALAVLPIGIRTHDELGLKKTRGQADSAPANFRPLKTVLLATAVSAILFGVFYANYVQGWIGLDDLEFIKPPEGVGEQRMNP